MNKESPTQIDARVRNSFERQGFMRKLGVQLGAVAEGYCECSLRFDETMTQQHGFFHAGATTTIADNAAGYAALTMMPEDATVLTTEFKVNLLAPARGPAIVAKAKVIKPGRTLYVVQSDVYSIDGANEAHVLTMLATAMCMMNKADAPRA